MIRCILTGLFLLVSSTLSIEVATANSRGLSVPLRASETPNASITEEIKLYGNSYALVIGIDEYTSGWPRLSNAVKDAQLIAEALTKKGFEVSLKTNLTSAQLKATFEEFFVFKGEDPEARLFIWFAGHGHTEDGEGFLIPSDAPLAIKGADFRFKALSLRRFGEFVRLAKSKHAFTIFDSCFSGTIFETSRSAPPPTITRATTAPARQFLTSGDAGQEVSDDGNFRRMFLEALGSERNADVNQDGFLTASELGLFLTDRITNYTNQRQTPRYGKLNDPNYDRGDFVFQLSNTPRGSVREKASSTTPRDKEVIFWESIKNSQAPGDYRAYLDQFPTGTFAGLAKSRIKSFSQNKKISARAKAHPYDGEWDGWLRTYGGMFNSPEEAEFKVRVTESRLEGTVVMYEETRTIRADIGKDGRLINGRLQGSAQGYDLHGEMRQGRGDGAWFGWKLEYKMQRVR